MNLWLSEHVDLDFLAKYGNAINVVGHSIALAKFRPIRRKNVVSPLHFVNKKDLSRYRHTKIAFNNISRTVIKNIFADSCIDLDKNFAFTLERLFYYAFQGCFDALAFACSSVKCEEIKINKLRIIIGGKYRLQELVALIWWLAVCLSMFKNLSIEFVLVSRTQEAIYTKNIETVLHFLSASNLTSSKFQGTFPEEFLSDNKDICLMWVGALRYPYGWDEVISRKFMSATNLLRISQLGMSSEYLSPCVEFSVGMGSSYEALSELFKQAERSLNEDKDTDKIVSYVKSAVAPLVIKQLQEAIICLDSNLGSVNCKYLMSVTAPFLETIALHEWCRRRDVLPILLPHSFTSSHEFSVTTYHSALAFIRSDNIMPSAYDESSTLSKEVIVSADEVKNAHEIAVRSIEKGLVSKNFLKNNFSYFFRLPLGQSRRMVWQKYKNSLLSKSYFYIAKRSIQNTDFKIGWLLNYEQFEFATFLDFNQLFKFITEVSSQMQGFFGVDEAKLILRRKPGWTNMLLLKRHLSKVKQCKNIVLSPDSMSLMTYVSLCDVIIFIQGTSAIPEMMSLGVPFIQLVGDDLPVMLDEAYVDLPESIVPRVTLKDFLLQIISDKNSFADFGNLQKEWVQEQMASKILV